MGRIKESKVLCFLNPLACDGLTRRRWPEVEAVFGELGIECEFVSHDGDLRDKALEALEEGRGEGACFAGVGGDGTQNALINGLMEYRRLRPKEGLPKYAIIPFGTGNNLAKSFAIGAHASVAGDLRRTLAATIHGAVYQLDLGKLGERYFADAFATGMDASVLAGRDRDKERISRNRLLYRLLRGYPLYGLNVFKSFFGGNKLSHAEIEVDGKPWFSGKLFNIVINNTRIYAGEFDLTDQAFANDGQLDMVLFTGRLDYLRRYLLSHRRLPRRLRSLAGDRNNSIKYVKGETFHIKWEKETPAQVDGEVIGSAAEYHIETKCRALKIRVPVEPA